MRSVKSLVKGWQTAGTGVAVLIVLQAFGPVAVWPQEPAQPRIDEEIAKQEKIYHSRGADVPSGYVTGRALSDYAELLPSEFCDALGRLGSSDRWLDIGAGDGQAILDYYALEDDETPAQKCARSFSKARTVAMSIEDRRTDKWQQQAAIFGGDRLRYLFGKRLRDYSPEELGKFQIITDVYGGFSYTEDLSQVHGEGAELARGRRRLLHDGAERAFRGWQGQTPHLLSNRAGGCSRPRRESVLLAEEDHLCEMSPASRRATGTRPPS